MRCEVARTPALAVTARAAAVGGAAGAAGELRPACGRPGGDPARAGERPAAGPRPRARPEGLPVARRTERSRAPDAPATRSRAADGAAAPGAAGSRRPGPPAGRAVAPGAAPPRREPEPPRPRSGWRGPAAGPTAAARAARRPDPWRHARPRPGTDRRWSVRSGLPVSVRGARRRTRAQNQHGGRNLGKQIVRPRWAAVTRPAVTSRPAGGRCGAMGWRDALRPVGRRAGCGASRHGAAWCGGMAGCASLSRPTARYGERSPVSGRSGAPVAQSCG
jgi:hypothetical protein